jgi:hypothetical protein
MFKRAELFVVAVLAIGFAGAWAPDARGQSFPLVASDFIRTTPHGFGDRNNSWAQAMIWWKNNLYVGTSRDSLCASLSAVHSLGVQLLGQALANTYLPYPPPDPDLLCAPDPADLPLQAEIWRWSPGPGWSRVFQSPDNLPNPGTGPPAPPRTGKFLPYDVAFRGFTSYTERDGTEALYAFGVNSTLLWDRNQLPPPRILRTTDGVNWIPVPQTPGTFLHDLPFNPDHSTYRSPVSYNGRIFVLSGPIFGQGSLIASADPSHGDNAWFLAEPAKMVFYELAVFNGWLYLGGIDPVNGYAVYKTQAQGTPPYPLIQVVPPGAGLTVRPSKSVVSMFVHNNRLYVGTATFPEMIRVNADDTWDLVMGSPRLDPVTKQMKYPTSNLDAGFGETLNDHVWYQDDIYGFMYAGTYHATTGSRFDPTYGAALAHNMGAHLYRTPDDWYYSAVTMNGFSDPSDPRGGKFDYGVRTMKSTPYGMFLGTANDYYGTEIFRASRGPDPKVESPGNLEIEPTKSGGALLSWLPSQHAVSYQVFRAPILPILIRTDQSFEDFNGVTGDKIPDTFVGVFQQIATTSDTFFLDSTVQTASRYMYYIVGAGRDGAASQPSNLSTFPLLLPPVTFAQALSKLNTLALRRRFGDDDDSQGSQATERLQKAQAAAGACKIETAIDNLDPESASDGVMFPDSIDIGVIFGKLVRRLQLFSRFPTQVVATEFCPGATPFPDPIPPQTLVFTDNFTYADQCTNENVQVTGTTTTEIHLTVDKGVAHLSLHISPNDTGIGLKSGAKYQIQAQGEGNDELDIKLVNNTGQGSSVASIKVAGPRNSEEHLKESLKVTVNPDGTVTLQRTSVSSVCSGE